MFARYPHKGHPPPVVRGACPQRLSPTNGRTSITRYTQAFMLGTTIGKGKGIGKGKATAYPGQDKQWARQAVAGPIPGVSTAPQGLPGDCPAGRLGRVPSPYPIMGGLLHRHGGSHVLRMGNPGVECGRGGYRVPASMAVTPAVLTSDGGFVLCATCLAPRGG